MFFKQSSKAVAHGDLDAQTELNYVNNLLKLQNPDTTA